MKYRLGLDIGIKSVGWAVIENEEITEEPIRIADLGVRTFDANEVDKTGESTAKDRREYRGVRRRRRRKSFRKIRMIKLLNKAFDIDYENDVKKILNEDVYYLRAKSLDEPIDNLSLSRIVMSILKRRGFKSNRKSLATNSEEGKLKIAIEGNRKYILEKGYRTIGEAIFKDEHFKTDNAGQIVYKVRNHNGEYDNCFYRDDLKEELKYILNTQMKKGNDKITDELISKIIEIFETQRNFDEGPGGESPYKLNGFDVGNCYFIPDEKRAPKASCTFEMFSALTKLNSLRINGNELTKEQFNLLLNKILAYSDIKFSQIRKLLKLDYDKTFNLCNYYVKSKDKDCLSDDEIINKVENSLFVSFGNTNKIKKAINLMPNGNEELFDSIALMLSLCKSDVTIDNYISENSGIFSNLNIEQINNIKSLNFDKFGSLSTKAMKKIIPYLIEGQRYNEACVSAGFNHSCLNCTKSKYLMGDEVNERLKDIIAPTVKRSVNQTIRIINKLIKKYGSPQFVTIELARDFGRTPSERKQIQNMQKSRFDSNQRCIEEIMKYKSKPNGNDVLKFLLYNEQDCKCMYSGDRIELENLFSDNYYQIDHILPISRSLDDSYNNKVLVKTCENQNKGNKTPYEYFKQSKSDSDWNEYLARVNNLKNYKKRKFLLTDNYSENRQNDFIERNSNDTRYISRVVLNLLQDFLLTEPNKKYKKVIKSVNGGVTAYLRKCWGINKIREDGDSHHCIDAAVIAVATDGMVKRITEFNKRKEQYIQKDNVLVNVITGEVKKLENENIGRVLSRPYESFVEELKIRSNVDYSNTSYDERSIKTLCKMGYMEEDLERLKPLFVSRMKTVKNTGPIHKDKMLSTKAYEKTGMLIKTIQLNELKLSVKPEKVKIKGDLHPEVSIEDYCKPLDDRKLYLLLKEKLIEDPDYFKKNAFITKPSRSEKEGIKVYKVKKYVRTSNLTCINGGAFESEVIYRIDIFKKEGKYFAIPIYMKDVYAHKLPTKIISKKDLQLDDTFEFQFSLYQNDMIEIEWNKDVKLSKVNDNEKSTRPQSINLNKGYFYYNSFDRSTSSIMIYTCDRCYVMRGVGIQNLKNIKKYYVDIMGNIYNSPKEVRGEL